MADLWQSNAQGDIEVKGNPHKLWSWVCILFASAGPVACRPFVDEYVHAELSW